ncbi:ADP-ribosylation factor-like protein 1 [Mizuhopecten yessoensis]|uniref:ADP-ribosylation factor-like protein 1 n=1 Tax=Mizuhopecten yessoensis TaxID=6573 RepID=A0A210Q751_MIZYE|nr:ADP-ribosylation factor-like protein 1 [Mizuhopecten yessoensis]OWF44568.1 ADP-ribosylation factor-like protein 1 [Mizuhopecten yessoensis]
MGKAMGKLSSSRKVTVLIIGQNGSGKTSLLHNLNLGNITNTFTDDYETIEALSGERVQAVAWNMFGSRCAGGIFTYYRNIDAFIYVVNDRGPPDNNMELAKVVFQFLEARRFSNSILAVAVNQRITGEGTRVTLEEVRSGLDLDNCSHVYELFPIVATTGEGLDKLQDWLSQELDKMFARQCFFGSGDQQQIQKRDIASFHTRILTSFKGLFTRI